MKHLAVINSTTIQAMLSLALKFGWQLRQVDFNNVFLNEELKEMAYMWQPTRLENGESLVCKLTKAFYSLKQALWAWHQKLSTFRLPSYIFFHSKYIVSLFIKIH